MRVDLLVTPPDANNPDGKGEEQLIAATLIGEWTAQRLEDFFGDGVDLRRVEPPTRDQLEARLREPGEGFAAFCHGTENYLEGRNTDGSPGFVPVLAGANVHVLRDRWGVAIACRAGNHLPGLAAEAGATCFAGYEAALSMEWHPEQLSELPQEIRERFQELTTEVTLLVAQGARDQRSIQQRVRLLAKPVEAWCYEHPGVASGIQILAQSLYTRLIVLTRES